MRALLALFLTAVVFIIAQGTGNVYLFHLFYIMAAALVTSYIWAWLNMQGLSARRELLSNRTQVGKPLDEHLVIENRSRVPKLWVEAEDRSDLPDHRPHFVAGLPPRASRHLRVRTVCPLRGRYTLGPLLLRSSDPLGLFHFQKRIAATEEVLVYPATDDIIAFPLPPAELPGGTATRRRTHYTTSNVSGVREYLPGDSFNRIHWPSSARQGRLIVKEFELDPTANIWIVLDMDYRVQASPVRRRQPAEVSTLLDEPRRPDSTEEYIVTAAASLARHFILRQRRNTGLIGWGQHNEVIPPEREPRQFYQIMESLTILRAYGSTPLAEVLAAEGNRFGRQTSVIVISSSPDPAWVRISLRDLLYRGIYAIAVLVDGPSFGGWHPLAQVETELLAHNVPFYVLKKGQPIGATLSGVAGAVDWQSGARYMREHYHERAPYLRG